MKRSICFSLCALLLCTMGLSASAQSPVLNIAIEENVIAPLSADDGRYQYALKALSEKYPGIEIRLESLPVMDGQQLLLEGKYDIALLRNPDAQRLKEAGAALPLSDHEGIAAALKDWPDKVIFPADDGKVYALPHWARPMLCRVVLPKLLKELALDLPEKWSWEDLFSIAPRLKEYNSQNSTAYRLLGAEGSLPYFLIQMAAAQQQPERSVIEALFSGRKALKEADLIAGLPDEQAKPLFEIALSNMSDESCYLPVPLYAQDGPGSELSTFSLVASPASQMKEASLDFIAAYAQPEALRASQSFDQSGIYPKGLEGGSELNKRAIRGSFRRIDRELLSGLSLAYWDYESGSLSLTQAVDVVLSQLSKGK